MNITWTLPKAYPLAMAGAPPVVVHSSPTNGLSIVKGEMGLVVAALRSANRWTAHTYHVSLEPPDPNPYPRKR